MKFRVIVGLLFLIYFATAFFSLKDNSFHNDDVEMITKSAAIYERAGSLWETDEVGRNHMLLYLVMGAVHRIFGMTPVVFYLPLLILHALVFFLMRALAQRIGLDPMGANISALFFLVLSVHFQIVGWIAEMGRLLMNVLSLASLLFFHRFRVSAQKMYLITCCFLWFLAFHCSEEAIILPCLFLVYDFVILKNNLFSNKDRRLFLSYVPFLAIALLMLFQLILYKEGAAVYFSSNFQVIDKIRGLSWTMANLVIPRREFFPSFLMPTEWNRILFPLAFLGPLGIIFYLKRHSFFQDKSLLPIAFFSLLWFAITFTPFSLRPMGDWREYPSPRYLYMAMIGISFLVGKIIQILLKGPARWEIRGGIILAAVYFYVLNVWTFNFMVNKLDQMSRVALPA